MNRLTLADRIKALVLNASKDDPDCDDLKFFFPLLNFKRQIIVIHDLLRSDNAELQCHRQNELIPSATHDGDCCPDTDTALIEAAIQHALINCVS